jgi:hypothetical protein
MAETAKTATWWEKEKQRHFTKLECGLLGAVFAATAIIFVLAMWIAAA